MKRLKPVFLLSALLLTSCSGGCRKHDAESTDASVTEAVSETVETGTVFISIPSADQTEAESRTAAESTGTTAKTTAKTTAASSKSTEAAAKTSAAEENGTAIAVQTVPDTPASSEPAEETAVQSGGAVDGEGNILLPAIPIEEFEQP